jgi:hypothetical protein
MTRFVSIALRVSNKNEPVAHNKAVGSSWNPQFKHLKFSEEKEWRLASRRQFKHSEILKKKGYAYRRNPLNLLG